MTLHKLALRAEETAYTLSTPTSLLWAQLDGGLCRTRLDFLDIWAPITVQWNTDQEGYDYLQQVRRYCEAQNNEHFIIDLIMNDGSIVEREAAFMPGTFALSSVGGFSHIVTAQLWAIPITGTDNTWPTPI